MYFPKGFSTELAAELGSLIVQAYEQFAAFERGTPWELSGGYEFLGEITYMLNRKKPLTAFNFDISLVNEPALKRRVDGRIPIGFIARKGNRLFLIFRGTQTVKEWTRNLSFSLKDCELAMNGKVHEGFIQTYLSARETILAPLAGERKKDRVFIAGHSLGGALATLAAPDVETHANLEVSAVYTFGCPRVGNDDFVQDFNRSFGKRSFRVVNTSDMVPSVPLPAPVGIRMGGYFSHVDTPVDFTAQFDDVEKNHEIETYLAALHGVKKRWLFG